MPRTVSIIDLAVNGAGNREAVTVTEYCWLVEILEKRTVANWPTTDYNVSDVASGGTYTHKKLGTSFSFPEGNFIPNDIVGYVETSLANGTPSGSSTFEVIQHIGGKFR